MKRICLFAVIVSTLALSGSAVAQAPVLFDGTNPVVFSFQDAPSDDAIPQARLITPDQLVKALQSAKQKPLVLEVGPRTLYGPAGAALLFVGVAVTIPVLAIWFARQLPRQRAAA